jgi:deoxyribodipyrimidine photo-lyase
MKIHQPWQLSWNKQKRFGVRLGIDYPYPMVDLRQSARANEKIYNAALAGQS